MNTNGILKLGAAEVDLGAQVVRTPSGDHLLSHLEARLLAFLHDHRGDTLPRARLLQEVWGYSPRVESRAVDHSISRLRKKIEVDPAHPVFLRSVRGVGYRLETHLDPEVSPRASSDEGGFFGRTAPWETVATALDEGVRLVTLHGPAGIGKTRLCQELLASRRARQGHVFAWLLDATNGADVLRLVATALGIGGLDSGDLERDREYLGKVLALRGPLVLALDNVEHLVDDVSACVEGWLRHAPELQIVTTSRRRLNQPGEQVVSLGPLAESDAVALMVHRARGVRDGYDPDPEERATLGRVARELDGLPLALELAAARLAVLDAAGVEQRLGERFRLLKGHRTQARWNGLAEALRWSWDLAGDVEQSVLAQCAVFAGGFELDAAEIVVECGDHWVPDVIGSLVDSALLQRTDDDLPRFSMLTSVRALVLELGHPGDARLRHRRWCATKVASLNLDGPAGGRVARRLAVELPNLWAAHADAIRAGDRGAAVPLAIVLHKLSQRRGPPRDGLRAVEPVLTLLDEDHPDWVELRWRYGSSLTATHRYADARAVLQETAERSRTDQDQAKAYCAMLGVLAELGDAEGFNDAAQRADAAAMAAADERRRLIVLQNRTLWEWAHGSLDQAVAMAPEVVRRAERLADIPMLIDCLSARILVANAAGAYTEAIAFADRGIALAQEQDLPRKETYLAVNAGQAYLQLGQIDHALARLDEATALAARMGDLVHLYVARLFHAEAMIDAGALKSVGTILDGLDREPHPPAPTVGHVAMLRARLHAAQGMPDLALPVLENAVAAIRESSAAMPTTATQVFAHLACLLAGRDALSEADGLLTEATERLGGHAHPVCYQLLDAARMQVLLAQSRILRRQASEAKAEADDLLERLGSGPRDVRRLLS